MATAKYNSKAKINFITTVGGRIKWTLNPIGMVATSHGVKRFIARTEVKKMLTEGTAQRFQGTELYRGGQVSLGTWSFNLYTSGRVEFGCMQFSKAAANTLRKWAQVE